MTWLYQNTPIETLPEDCVGFVYLITNLENQRQYIGKKLAKFQRTKQKVVKFKNGNKKKRKIRFLIESDWRDYWSSSDELISDIKKLGSDKFKREILRFCKSKAECSYFEAKYQFEYKVLESDKFYNGQISVRCHQSHIKGKI